MHPFDYITAHDENVEWKRLARDPRNKIDAIKALRHATGMGLKEAKDTVEEYARRIEGQYGPTVKSTVVRLPEGHLTIVQNGLYASIQYTRTEAVNVRIENLAQAIADATIRNTKEAYNGPRA